MVNRRSRSLEVGKTHLFCGQAVVQVGFTAMFSATRSSDALGFL